MTLFRRMLQNYENFMIRKGREEARHILLTRSDRALEDLGFSRYLLESGIEAWPWSAPSEDSVNPLSQKQQAITELKALDDKDLQDLGISRGQIVESVEHGREGIEQERKVA